MPNAMRVSDFINTLGVGGNPLQQTITDLQYLGIKNVRTSIPGYALQAFQALGQSGAKVDLLLPTTLSETTASLQSEIQTADTIQQAGGDIVAVEGANEINNWPITYNGVGGLQGGVNYQQAIYQAIKADPNLANAAVYYFTGWDSVSGAPGPNPATTSGLANYDNQHPYPMGGEPPDAVIQRNSTILSNEGNGPYGPAVVTETGYSTNPSSWATGVSQDVQAKYDLDAYFDGVAAGYSKTYIYKLYDNSPSDDGFGLFDYNNTPKEAATAIHNMTSILADTGSNASTFTPGTLNYSVSGEPSDGHDLLMQKSNGAYDIAVWNEPEIWNTSTSTETPGTPVSETVNLGQTFASVSVYDPLKGTTPVQTLSNVSSVNLSVTDHPLIVEASGTVASSPSPQQLQLVMSEDAWRGNAQFILTVDGKQIGGTETVTALHQLGQTQTFNFTPILAAGKHDVGIDFINDAYGGTASTDRNLYVNQVNYNGTPALSHTLPMYSSGIVHVSVGHS